jgi:hypothetical protein
VFLSKGAKAGGKGATGTPDKLAEGTVRNEVLEELLLETNKFD